jgi:CPA1 family monovalent cation:H+ antiporter
MWGLALEDDKSVEREVQLARTETARAGLAALEAADHKEELVRLLRSKYEARLTADGMPAFTSVLRRAQAEERRTLSELRARGVIGDDAFHRVEEELDWAEVNADALARSAQQQ